MLITKHIMVYKTNLSFIRQNTKVRGSIYTYYFIKALFNEHTVKYICQDKPIHECSVNVIITRENINKLIIRLYNLKEKLEKTQTNIEPQLKEEIINILDKIIKMIKE